MKKILSLILCALMLFSSVTVIADSTEAAKVQEVLLKVKPKITVPEGHSKFSTSSYTRGEKTIYDFSWDTPDYRKAISVSCDDEGRILSYFDNSREYSEKLISSLNKQQIINYAEEILKRMLPDAFASENDTLVYDESSWYTTGNLSYSLEFIRLRNSIPVKNNYVNLDICISGDEPYVRTMRVEYNYNAEFEDAKTPAENFVQMYKEAFPVEMVYINEYVYHRETGKSETVPKLIYRIKDDAPGYIDISSGEIIDEDALNGDAYLKGEAADKLENSLSGSGSSVLTPEELEEMENISGLLSIDEIEKKLKSLPYLKFPGKLSLYTKNLHKGDSGDYYYGLHYSHEEKNDYSYFNANVNAQSGEILRISNSSSAYEGSGAELTQMQIDSAKKKIDEFLSKVCKERLAETELTESVSYSQRVSSLYTRIVNGVRFIDNGINISFDAKNNVVTGFNLNFTKAEFTNPADCINSEEAYRKITEYSPIDAIYILSGGKYIHAASLKKHYVRLDALNGEVINAETKEEYTYSDIDDHWVLEAATRLSDHRIGYPQDKLEPEKEATQEELLRLWMLGIYGNYVADLSTDDLYEILVNHKILGEDEKSPEAVVKREDAFVYFIRMCGYEKIAALSDIYKVNYIDSALLSADKTGYAAILSGLGVVCGDGGELRPSDAITRAESLVMLYKYLLNI